MLCCVEFELLDCLGGLMHPLFHMRICVPKSSLKLSCLLLCLKLRFACAALRNVQRLYVCAQSLRPLLLKVERRPE